MERKREETKGKEFMVIAFLLPGIEGDVVSCLWYALVSSLFLTSKSWLAWVSTNLRFYLIVSSILGANLFHYSYNLSRELFFPVVFLFVIFSF